MSGESGALRLGRAQGAARYFLLDRPVSGGDVVQLCCSGGWITGRFEWDAGMGGAPIFFFSIELGAGGIAQQSIVLPSGALMRWP
jgi:hypothetical protein